MQLLIYQKFIASQSASKKSSKFIHSLKDKEDSKLNKWPHPFLTTLSQKIIESNFVPIFTSFCQIWRQELFARISGCAMHKFIQVSRTMPNLEKTGTIPRNCLDKWKDRQIDRQKHREARFHRKLPATVWGSKTILEGCVRTLYKKLFRI